MTSTKQGKGVQPGSGIPKHLFFKLTLYHGPLISCRITIASTVPVPARLAGRHPAVRATAPAALHLWRAQGFAPDIYVYTSLSLSIYIYMYIYIYIYIYIDRSIYILFLCISYCSISYSFFCCSLLRLRRPSDQNGRSER